MLNSEGNQGLCLKHPNKLVDTLLLFGLADLCDPRVPLMNAHPYHTSFHGDFLGLL